MNDNKKVAFIIIVVLLAIFFPFTIISIVFHVKYVEGNPNHEFHYYNKLWFYDNAGSLIGTYDCNFDNCDYASEIILDSQYGMNPYTSKSSQTKSLIANRYAFISDSSTKKASSVILYDIVEQKKNMVRGYKIYSIGLDNDYVITISDEGKYGVVQLSKSGFVSKIPVEYDFIALQNEKDSTNKHIKSDVFIASKDEQWKLLDSTGNELTANFSAPIVEFNDNVVITKKLHNDSESSYFDEGTYNLYSYEGTQRLSENYKYLHIVRYDDGSISNYVDVINNENKYYVVDTRTGSSVTEQYEAPDINEIQTLIANEGLVVAFKGINQGTVEIH